MADQNPVRWQDLAECLSAPPEVFFPERAEGEVNRGEDAKAYCARCPVAVECLEAAVARREKHGVWGGAGEPTRRRLAKLTDAPRFVADHRLGCTCAFHVAAREHVAAVSIAYTRTGEVRHGRWQAYVHAGCRCVRCSEAHAAEGRRPNP